MIDDGFNVGFGSKCVRFGDWLHASLTLCTLEHIKGDSSSINNDLVASPSLDVGDGSSSMASDVVKSTTVYDVGEGKKKDSL